ncbi:MAG: zinc ribbon domain-containing protein [Candidatus Thorarchaeota archaeon]|nr:MAG: hypothetical protein DRP09_11440 [Candidatus Thorarchaeota archaeon]RLI58132.1 MAG: hypothetical protein DRO87_06145 [Candidatus Thorarchaeota archaeon]
MRYSDYDDGRHRERPVRLDRTEGHVVIDGRAYPARELIEALAQGGYAELRDTGDSLIIGSRRISPIFKSRQEKAMASLCHGSLAYCCPLSKRCAERDRALEVLGLTANDYESLKRNAHAMFVESARGFDRPSPFFTEPETRGRTVNRPAVDTGYGSDDYRRDFESLDRTMQSLSEHYGAPQDSWRGSVSPRQDPYGRREREREKRTYDDLSALVDENVGSRGVCNVQRDESLEGIGSLFAQGELSPFADDAQEESKGETFCFSCGRSIRAENRTCPYCGARQ